MLIGEVYLEALASGIITQEEIDWLTTHQSSFNRDEEAKARKIGRLLDEGAIQIGCRLLGKARGVDGTTSAAA
jgi:3-oxoacyl-[acyl-carrier-protein] synthase III